MKFIPEINRNLVNRENAKGHYHEAHFYVNRFGLYCLTTRYGGEVAKASANNLNDAIKELASQMRSKREEMRLRDLGAQSSDHASDPRYRRDGEPETPWDYHDYVNGDV
ncbi:hypothetical protein F0231_02220 [Vibrio sp. RE86]|uniref:hypothetical protein n=1 Tax=Vibrio sp. RE86 TaxID=2607605 RepID=UPI001493C621|nr:hypothetical protein [Vibrio sp. RE86]NOH78552.1 hypothetical protein [Vibrio sp. RE86]